MKSPSHCGTGENRKAPVMSKHNAEQFEMPLKKERKSKRTDGVFKRGNIWQARMWIGGRPVRRTTTKKIKAAAEEMLPLLKTHL